MVLFEHFQTVFYFPIFHAPNRLNPWFFEKRQNRWDAFQPKPYINQFLFLVSKIICFLPCPELSFNVWEDRGKISIFRLCSNHGFLQETVRYLTLIVESGSRKAGLWRLNAPRTRLVHSVICTTVRFQRRIYSACWWRRSCPFSHITVTRIANF